ncbi:MAG: YwaF family protein [Candidatus Izimaplasma sp.]|nr:YwaF family protein [Candidatus Izimaplasma bacterium]
MLNIYGLYHFIWILLIPVIIYGVYYLLKTKSVKFKYWFLFGLTLLAWGIHFSRYWLDPDFGIYKLFFVDLCGFSTMMYPFFFLSKKNVFKDYMYYSGALFAFLSLAYPNTINGNSILAYDSIRFFFAHVILVMVPVLLAAWKMHVPNIKNLGWIFVMIMIGGIYNMALTSFFVEVGLVSHLINYMGIWGKDGTIYHNALLVAPWLTYDKIISGEIVKTAIPFFYIIPAAFLVLMPTWVIMSIPFVNWQEFKERTYKKMKRL